MQTKHFPRLIFSILMVFIISIVIGQAQEENLLTNPGFEDGFSGSGVASDWESWVSSDADAPGFQEAPDYIRASDASDNGLIPQVRSGDEAQAMFSFFATHDAGIYQQVDVTKGSELRFSIYGHVFSNNLADVDESANPGGVTIRVGIDPTGGTDPFSDDIVYTEPFITYDTYIQYNVIATADSDTVTVFVRSTITEPVQNTIVFLDDAVLNVTPESSVPDETEEPTDEPTEEPTDEVVQEATPTREVVVETEEPTDEPTEEPTDEATPEPTEEPEDDTPISDEFPLQFIHTVVSGDTVGALATRFGSSIEAIIEINGLNDSALIFREQELIIPVTTLPTPEAPTAIPVATDVVDNATEVVETETPVTDGTQYTVVRGDTLSSIARQFNTTVGALVQLNGITNQNRILAGQVLTLPGTGGSTEPEATSPPPAATAVPTATPDTGITSYVVLPGDNLYRIALRNGVSLTDLAEANNITNFNLIFVGQVLTIP
ncbi:MAG: hypothetical protein Phog2KO_01670 [Phototrophicaceae bacterium]